MKSSFKPPVTLQMAVLFLVFNRPDTTAQVFESIRQAKPPRLYVAADGPRKGREGEAQRVAQVREIATAVDWSCEVKTLFREKNLGCKSAVEQAITWFFAAEEAGIILEDDCLPKISFFYFAEQLLSHYADDEQVVMISGTNHLGKSNYNNDSYFFGFGDIWGWAAWRRSWKLYDSDLAILANEASLKKFKSFCELTPWIFSDILSGCQKVKKGSLFSWGYPWAMSRIAAGGLSIVPSVNLIQNIGFGDDATHTKSKEPQGKPGCYEINFPLVHPVKKEMNFHHYKKRRRIEIRRRTIHLLSLKWLGRRIKRLLFP